MKLTKEYLIIIPTVFAYLLQALALYSWYIFVYQHPERDALHLLGGIWYSNILCIPMAIVAGIMFGYWYKAINVVLRVVILLPFVPFVIFIVMAWIQSIKT